MDECKPLATGSGMMGPAAAAAAEECCPADCPHVLRPCPAPPGSLGWAVQVEHLKPMLKAPGTKRMKLKTGTLSFIAFKINLRR